MTTDSIKEAIDKVLKSAGDPWLGGVDLEKCGLKSRLDDPHIFDPAHFISTGYEELDFALGGGWALGECTNMFGPSSVGKTTVAVNLAVQAMMRYGVGFLSLEMTASDLSRLVVGIECNISRGTLRRGTLSQLLIVQRDLAIKKLRKSMLCIVDRHDIPRGEQGAGIMTDTLELIIRDGVKRKKWKVIFVDYLTKIAGPKSEDEFSRVARLSDWA